MAVRRGGFPGSGAEGGGDAECRRRQRRTSSVIDGAVEAPSDTVQQLAQVGGRGLTGLRTLEHGQDLPKVVQLPSRQPAARVRGRSVLVPAAGPCALGPYSGGAVTLDHAGSAAG
ncbi:hypothetical protein GCM10010236_75590 [Streptomyces eurythermus]|nr:hypothetical protein GCM10010236_75590 [Streptomyces eurythermus]